MTRTTWDMETATMTRKKISRKIKLNLCKNGLLILAGRFFYSSYPTLCSRHQSKQQFDTQTGDQKPLFFIL